MKRLCIIILAIVCLGLNRNTYAEIRNGYDIELIKVEKWLGQLHEIANDPLNESQREKMKKKLEEAQDLVDNLRENYAKTQELIEMFRMIDPELYHEINTIQDSEGNETDVYIKVVDQLGGGLHGATNVGNSDDNPNIYHSEYGDYTVSVRIAHVNLRKDLWSLVHELGHVRYQVPHLADYASFHKKVYQNQHFAGIQGHHPDDPGAYATQETLHDFKTSWKKYNRAMKWMAQDKSRKIMAFTREE